MTSLLSLLFRVVELALSLSLGGMGLILLLRHAVHDAVWCRDRGWRYRRTNRVKVLYNAAFLCLCLGIWCFFCTNYLLGDLVGGTTLQGVSGQWVDGTYHLYAWWLPDQYMEVSPEKFWALFLCERLIWVVGILFTLLLGIAGEVERRQAACYFRADFPE